jgi:hypothetical protein
MIQYEHNKEKTLKGGVHGGKHHAGQLGELVGFQESDMLQLSLEVWYIYYFGIYDFGNDPLTGSDAFQGGARRGGQDAD